MSGLWIDVRINKTIFISGISLFDRSVLLNSWEQVLVEDKSRHSLPMRAFFNAFFGKYKRRRVWTGLKNSQNFQE